MHRFSFPVFSIVPWTVITGSKRSTSCAFHVSGEWVYIILKVYILVCCPGGRKKSAICTNSCPHDNCARTFVFAAFGIVCYFPLPFVIFLQLTALVYRFFVYLNIVSLSVIIHIYFHPSLADSMCRAYRPLSPSVFHGCHELSCCTCMCGLCVFRPLSVSFVSKHNCDKTTCKRTACNTINRPSMMIAHTTQRL